MRTKNLNAIVKAAVMVAGMLLAGTMAAFGQQQVNLTAGPAGITVPDGSGVPMWGFNCGVVIGAVSTGAAATTYTAATATTPATAAVTGGTLQPNAYVGSTITAGSLTGIVASNTATTVTLTAAGWTGGAAGATPTNTTPFSLPASSAGCAPLNPLTAGGKVGAVAVVKGGTGYTSQPTVAFVPTGTFTGTAATAVAAIANGQVVSITLTSPGLGYTSAPAVTLTGGGGTGAAATAGLAWSPVQITVPSGQALTINLTNNLSFTPPGTTTPNNIPTSIVIVGQVGGGLGSLAQRTTSPAPDHSAAQANNTWFTANTGSSGTPPVQGARVRSFSTEVQATPASSATQTPIALTWNSLRPGTYLLQSGTHPSIQVPMGLIGVLVVTCPPGTATCGTTPAGTAYPAVGAVGTPGAVPAVTYNAEVPLEFSEIDPVQNREVNTAVNTVGFSENATMGPYLGGQVSHIFVSNPGSGYNAPPFVSITGGGATTAATAVATIDTTPGSPTQGQVTFINVSNGGAGYTSVPHVNITGGVGGIGAAATAELALGTNALGHCGEGSPGLGVPIAFAGACYPPAVNYTPFYYLINGVAFNKTFATGSVFAATQGTTTGTVTGNVLVRLVNAGLRMHVPSIVGSQTAGFSGSGAAAVVSGFALIAEDGNPVPGVVSAPRVQTDVFMAAGKTFDVMINAPAAGASDIPVFDRQLSLSGNSSGRDAGMLAYLSINGGTLPAAAAAASAPGAAVANPDAYNSLVACTVAPCTPLVVSDASKGVIANDFNVYGVAISIDPTHGSVVLNSNGTFTYTPNVGTTSDSFVYCANGTTTVCATVALGASALTGNPTALPVTYTANTASYLKIAPPGILSVDTDPNNLPLTVNMTPPLPTLVGGTLVMDAAGGFTASLAAPCTATTGCSHTFSYQAKNSQGRLSNSAMVTIIFPPASNLSVKVVDSQAFQNCAGHSTCINALPLITDYRWIIEEDKTFWVDPNCTTNFGAAGPPAGCPNLVGPSGTSTIPTFAVNFHTSHMEYVAQGCTGPLSCEKGQTIINPASGAHVPTVCDVGDGVCRTTGSQWTPVNPSQVHLDPLRRYYISVLPGDAANPFNTGNSGQGCTPTATTKCPSIGHTMTGAPIPAPCNIYSTAACPANTPFAPVLVTALASPLPTGKLSVIVFEDDFPLNGEQDAGGGVDVLSPNEPGLGGFNLVLWDAFGGLGDVTGQNSYDMFNQPLSNALSGTIDPATGLDACPISAQATSDPTQAGITGMIVTCPKFEGDQKTLSPLAGQAIIANLMPGKFNVQAYPAADRIARGEEWLQTNTLDGQHPHDSFIRIGEPSYFQEYGPAGYHVSIGFANPKIINDRHAAVCAGAFGAVGPCNNTITGQVVDERLSRTPDQRLYPSGSRNALAWTQCWASLGDPDAEDFEFVKCDANGNFTFTNVPPGGWRVTLGDQWNDQIIDGLSTPANVGNCTITNGVVNCTGSGTTLNMGQIGVQQWQSNVYTRTYVDDNRDGIWEANEIGIPFLNVHIWYRNGESANMLATDFNGIANFNETFPLFNWYVVETDSTRYKTTGVHTVYDAGGPSDGSTSCGSTGGSGAPCGTSPYYAFLANTYEQTPLPPDLSVPGAVYCAAADCQAESASFQLGTAIPSSNTTGSLSSTGRIDPPWVWSEGWSGEIGEGNFIDFGKAPYAPCPPACAVNGTTATTWGENGGIVGYIQYASTRPFDSAEQMIRQPWTPGVPHVTINLYQEGFADNGSTPTLKLVDTTQSSSWDDWAQGFYPNYTDPTTGTPLPYMNCPGQMPAPTSTTPGDLFFYTLFDQPNYLDLYNSQHNGGTLHALPYNSQFKCYDAMHIWNQIQPAPYDGHYSFPSVTSVDPTTGKPNGTNCTICVPNPTTATPPSNGDFSAYDPYRTGTPMLPPGKYVVQVVLPPGYEIEKEEDKNLLIGDNFIAPAVQEFAGLGGNIFIMPDQASVASLYDPSGAGYNPNNAQNATTAFANAPGELAANPGWPGQPEEIWPCVGEMRTVPDYLSLFPQAQEVAPFAGAIRPLCDRKEVLLRNQMGANAKFYIYTSTHIASSFTGVITDDFTSEFDPFSPQFGEKFAPPNMPVSTRDYLGNEISRVYSDHFGVFDGLTYSSWEVDPPNITGYSPTMMVQCMNDAGPILDTRITIPNPNGTGTIPNPTLGQLINDPLYNPAYSDFCYELPYMPGVTTYLDTPVVPTQAFVGAAYNNTDCAYPDATPAIAEVDGDGIGPWVSASGTTKTLFITALGNQTVNNYGYAGPSASVAPFSAKTVSRHYGFGTRCTSPTAGSATCNTASSVTIGGVAAPITSWADTLIQVTVPGGVPACTIQQQAEYAPGATQALCGELVITAGNGKQSVDTVTVTIGGKAPTHVASTGSIQSAIDAAAPGDLIIVDPTCKSLGATVACARPSNLNIHSTAAHTEMLIMWKPVRLQGVGAATTIINANAHPAGKLLDPWRRHINCLFGLTLQGVPYTSSSGAHPYDPTKGSSCPDTGWQHFTAQPDVPQIDRLPLESTVGWDATLNGNLGELLQEPSLMGAYEGAGITVLGKGLDFHGANPWGDTTEAGAFPTGTTLLTGVVANPGGAPGTPGALLVGDANPLCHTSATMTMNPFPSNYICNPSSIDGLSITNSSQGGGGIFVHGWAHFLQIANNRVYNNAGTLSGGISVGQGEFAPVPVQGSTTNAAPGSCSNGAGLLTNQHMPFCLQLQPSVHNNMITANSSIGDELFSATLSGGGGATLCTGNDYYKFNYNWVCGNISAGEGGGMVHLGEIYNGDIEHNSILFNQSSNPTIPTNGGGIMIQGTPDTDPVCGTQPDADCPPGLSDGTGPGLVINANLVQGNSADSGSGGGIRLQSVNGTEVSAFPSQPNLWHDVTITNNIIVNNMAGWDGAGISLQDALNVNIVNNTIAHNDTLASSGVLANSIGAPLSSAPPGNCSNGAGSTASCPQSAGVTSMANTSLLTTTFTGLTITCPAGHPGCTAFSNPILYGDVLWQNRSFYIGVGGPGAGTLNQQNLITLFITGTSTPAPTQATTGACSTGVTYWDLGVRGDTSPTPNSGSGFSLSPVSSILSTAGYTGNNNSAADPAVISSYCNGSRVPPECTVTDGCGGLNGFGVPPGIADAVVPNPIFSLTPSATVDEGNNWINVSWGPLSLTNPSVRGGPSNNFGGGPLLGNYGLTSSSPAVNYITCNSVTAGSCVINPANGLPTLMLPTTDFFGNPRPDASNTTQVDVGAVEVH